MKRLHSLSLFLTTTLTSTVLTQTATAGHRFNPATAYSFGVGVSVSPNGYGVWGFVPTYYQGFYGTGFSAYGPPVPTYGPVPGVFGGSDQLFGRYPPLLSGGLIDRPLPDPYPYVSPYAPLPRGTILPAPQPLGPNTLPAPDRIGPSNVLPMPTPTGPSTNLSGGEPTATNAEPPMVEPQPLRVSTDPAPSPTAVFRMRVRVPETAIVYIDGNKTNQSGEWRGFASPPLNPTEVVTYEIRAEWDADGKKHSETRTITGKPGQPHVVDFTK
jgi:uncharacterized protein (TIGR03000 family)